MNSSMTCSSTVFLPMPEVRVESLKLGDTSVTLSLACTGNKDVMKGSILPEKSRATGNGRKTSSLQMRVFQLRTGPVAHDGKLCNIGNLLNSQLEHFGRICILTDKVGRRRHKAMNDPSVSLYVKDVLVERVRESFELRSIDSNRILRALVDMTKLELFGSRCVRAGVGSNLGLGLVELDAKTKAEYISKPELGKVVAREYKVEEKSEMKLFEEWRRCTRPSALSVPPMLNYSAKCSATAYASLEAFATVLGVSWRTPVSGSSMRATCHWRITRIILEVTAATWEMVHTNLWRACSRTYQQAVRQEGQCSQTVIPEYPREKRQRETAVT
ncbi:hypothetical protein BGW80DRAFT_1506541 [Lactifluus volemus]|nr:hypothetical protein BGW80DRAFT_1506541 [Lactifluus volemus]